MREARYKLHKLTRLKNAIAQQMGSEVSQKLAKHNLNTLNVENLTWVTGKRYGGRWNHSRQQETITHSLARVGIRVKKVNPKNTSQTCHKCGNQITHKTEARTVWCEECRTELNRDFNAAMNIAKKNLTTYPVTKRDNGSNPTSGSLEVAEQPFEVPRSCAR